jgi:pyroglutamyl-peptidase
MKLPKILVAGFGSWAKAAANPAQAIALELGARNWDICDLIGIEMPVEGAGLIARIDALLDEHQPDAWIGVGVSSAANVQLEMIGINWCNFDVPDTNGRKIQNQPVIVSGPAAYNASLPNVDIVETIKAAGIPAALSFHAGAHLCNQMLYTSAHIIETKDLNCVTGFVHVPRTPANVLEGDGEHAQKPSMSLPMSCEAVAHSIETTVRVLHNH